METTGEYARFLAYGNQLVEVHLSLREMLADLRDGVVPDDELAVFCLSFCTAVTRHHTGEDREVFPVLAGRHPELRSFLDELERDHVVIASILGRLNDLVTDSVKLGQELDGLAAVLETHFIGEEKRLVGVLNALDSSVGLTPLTEAVEFR